MESISAMSGEGEAGRAFVTRIKQKCVESNPHLLATMIKRKHETLNRAELYQFIRRIVDKTHR